MVVGIKMALYVGVKIDTGKGEVEIGTDGLVQGRVRDVAVLFTEVQRRHDFKREPYPQIIIDTEFEIEMFARMVKEEVESIALDDEGYLDVTLKEDDGNYDFYMEQLALGNAEWIIHANKVSENSKRALKKAFIDKYFNEDLLYGYTLNQIKKITLTFS